MSQQMMEEVQAATAPFSMSHVNQEWLRVHCPCAPGFNRDENCATVMSIDGISACDLVSRHAMLQSLKDLERAMRHCYSYRCSTASLPAICGFNW